MPSVAQEASDIDGRASGGCVHGLAPILGKKRRWEDARSSGSGGSIGGGDGDVVAILLHGGGGGDPRLTTTATAVTTAYAHPTVSLQRRILPLASSKRVRLSSGDADDNDDGGGGGGGDRLCASPPGGKTAAAREASGSSASAITPCHVCHRRPRRKCDLDSLADCAGCGQRTCFVCLRECLGWPERRRPQPGGDAQERLREGEPVRRHASSHDVADAGAAALADVGAAAADSQPWSSAGRGHRRMVCSQCCVERGEDGDVMCLGCVALSEE